MPAIIRLNEGNWVHVDLVNVPETHLVKVAHFVGAGSSPIGATPTQVGGKLLYLHGDVNQEFGPLQPLCLLLEYTGSAYRGTIIHNHHI